MTCALAEKVYTNLSEKNVLLDEQKWCRKDSRGKKDQLLIDKQILKHCKKHQHNLATAWFAYEKAYDMVPHGWMIKAMKRVGILDNIVNLFKNSKEAWRTELTASNESLGDVDITRGIIQGFSFPPLLFVVVLLPFLIILNETDLRYVTSGNQKLNHPFFMDDLNLHANSQGEWDSLIQPVMSFSADVGWYLVWQVSRASLEEGKMVWAERIELPHGKRMGEVNFEETSIWEGCR